MSEAQATAPSPAPTVTVNNSDYRFELARGGVSWWTGLGPAAQFALLTSVVMIALASAGLWLVFTRVIPAERKLMSESYERINKEHLESYEKLSRDHTTNFDRAQSDQAKSIAAMEAAHRAEISRMFATIEDSVKRFEAVSMNQSQLVQSLLHQLLEKQGAK